MSIFDEKYSIWESWVLYLIIVGIIMSIFGIGVIIYES